VVALLLAVALSAQLRDGDVIFHQSRSAQSRAIQLATKSPYSHMGMLFRRDGRWLVYEAVGPVKSTPLDEWIARGDGGHFVVIRLRTPVPASRLLAAAEKYRGKPYDFYFEWSDRRIYCSELVWKVFKDAAGIEVGGLQRLREFDLSSPEVRRKMAERYGARVPLDEPVISPAAMFVSDQLVDVARR
jgi:hypothetical protein